MPLTTWFRRLPFFPPSPSPSPVLRQTNWADDTFIDSEEAEIALCSDRFSFRVRSDIMAFIPSDIRKHINHPDPSAHILGFQKLFVHLNNDRGSMRLRQTIEDYFNNSPPLRGHLSQSSFVSCDDTDK